MKKILLILVVLFSFWSIRPLFHAGFFPMHDDTQVARVITMAKALGDGMLPVRWVDILGYNLGYPIFNFYAPFAYYVGGVFVLLGFAGLSATKIMLGLGMLLAGVTMYFLVNTLFGKKAGFLAALFYVYAPYHALNLYVRGAVGEMWAYAFLPLPFWGLWAIYKTGRFRYVVLTVMGIASVVLSHNLTAMILLPFLLSIVVLLSVAAWRKKEFMSIYYFFISLVLGGMLAGFYAVPALLEIKYTNVSSILGGGSNPLDHFVCMPQLWQSMWGFAGSAKGCSDGMSFMLGKLHIIFFVAGLGCLIYFYGKKSIEQFWVMLVASCVVIGAIFMMLPESQIIWKSISFLTYVQFPWRFLSIASFASSVAVGGVLVMVNRYKPFFAFCLAIGMGIVAIMYYGKFFNPQYYKMDISAYTDLQKIAWDTSKISDEYMPPSLVKPRSSEEVPKQFIEAITGAISINSIDNKTQKKIVVVRTDGAVARLNLAVFPAWHITIDNKEVQPKIDRGRYSFALAAGTHTVSATYRMTSAEQLGTFLSLISFSLLIAGIIKTRKSKSL